jgi:signal transduction histidine kinase
MHQQYQTEKYESLKVLSNGIAHDFNNFLTIIYCNLEFLKTDEILSKDAKESIDNIFLALESARGLIRQLKILSTKSDVSMIKEDIIPYIQDVAKLITSRTKSSYILESEFKNLVLNFDKGQIIQAFTNLLLNAVQAMPNGGKITIKIRSEPNFKTDQSLKKDFAKKFVQISIHDEGKGIPKEYLSKIFTPYFTTKENGTGLGLAVTKSIIEMHGGTIDFQSEENKGTTFFIYLPQIASSDRDEKLKK